MKIERGNVVNLVNAYNKNTNKIVKSNNLNEIKDKVEISNVGKQLYEYQNDITVDREEKTLAIKESVENGTYKAQGECIASKMLDQISFK